MTNFKHILFLSALLMAFTGQANSEEAKAAEEAAAAAEATVEEAAEGAAEAAEAAVEDVTEGAADAAEAAVEDAAEAVTDAAEEAVCDMPAGPIIPDGNVASEDELVAAQKAMKMFQTSLISYRNCLQGMESKIDMEADTAVAHQDVILNNYNLSVDAEAKVAEEFNAAVRAFKARQE